MQDIPVITQTTKDPLPADLARNWRDVFADPATARPADVIGISLPLIDVENGIEVLMEPGFLLCAESEIIPVDLSRLENIDKSALHGIIGQIACEPQLTRLLSDALGEAAVFEPAGGRSQAWLLADGCLLKPEGEDRLFSPRHLTSSSWKTLGDHYRILVRSGDSSHARIEATARAQRIADLYSRHVIQADTRAGGRDFKRNLRLVPRLTDPFRPFLDHVRESGGRGDAEKVVDVGRKADGVVIGLQRPVHHQAEISQFADKILEAGMDVVHQEGRPGKDPQIAQVIAIHA